MSAAASEHPLAWLFAGLAHAPARALLTHVCLDPHTPLDDAHLRGLDDPAEASWLLQAAKRTTTAGLLWARLTAEQRAQLPETLGSGLRELYLGYGLQAECAKRLLALCGQQLAAAGVPVIALKGAALVTTIYGDPAERPMNDVDLLAREEDVLRAYRALSGEEAPSAGGERHLPPLRIAPGLPPVELHGWREHVAAWPQEEAHDPFVEGPGPAIDGAALGRLSVLNNWLHLACHGTSHTFGIWPRMAADLARLQESEEWTEGQWQRVWELASAHGQRRRALIAAAFTHAGRLPEALRAVVPDGRFADEAERRARRAWWAAWERHGPGTVKWVKLWTGDPERLGRALVWHALPPVGLTAARLGVPRALAGPLVPAFGLARLVMLGVSTVQGLRLIRMSCRVGGPVPGPQQTVRRGTGPPARPSLAECLAVLPHVALLLYRLRRVPREAAPAELVAAATPPPGAGDWSPSRARAAAALSRALVRRLPRLFPQPCLYYCLGGYYCLRRGGERPTLHIGVREGEGGIASHAWLTLNGEPVFDDATQQGFVEMISYQ